MSFQSHKNLEEKCKKKIEHFVRFNPIQYGVGGGGLIVFPQYLRNDLS